MISNFPVRSKDYREDTILEETMKNYPKGVDIKNSLLERHKEAVKYMVSKREPDINIINKVLLFNPIIESIHIDLCQEIYNNKITLDLPRSGEDSVTSFSKVAGV